MKYLELGLYSGIPIRFSDERLSRADLVLCVACGSVVADADRHDVWHTAITSIASDAREGAMMTRTY